jgi:polysaccharide deacetylase family protein (PEP-CTERM system associated)
MPRVNGQQPTATPQFPTPNFQPHVVNALTVDVEDYYHVSAFEQDVQRDHWDQYASRVVGSTGRLLELLGRHGVQATFFVLGWVAERHPQLVRDLYAAGHEVGSHGYWHRLIYRQSVDEFRQDVRRSRQVLEDAIGAPVTTYRAPSFSITRQSQWALQVLVEEGFLVDSSVFPIYHDRYGIPGAQPRIHSIATPAGPLWEFPPSVVRWAGLTLPIGGGGYFRLYPFWLTYRGLLRINRREHRPFMVYVHPWEIDPDQPRLGVGSRVSRFRHYVNLGRTERKLNALLSRFHFATLTNVVHNEAVA